METVNKLPRPLSEEEKDRRMHERLQERVRQMRAGRRPAIAGDRAEVAARLETMKQELDRKLAAAFERLERHKHKEDGRNA